jgi:hypothetical protein
LKVGDQVVTSVTASGKANSAQSSAAPSLHV